MDDSHTSGDTVRLRDRLFAIMLYGFLMATRRRRVILRSHSEMVKVSPHWKAGVSVFNLDKRTLGSSLFPA